MNKILLYFCLLLLIISLTSCESNLQNISFEPPLESSQNTIENNEISEVTPPAITAPTEETTPNTVEGDPIPSQESIEPTLPPQQSSSNEENSGSNSEIGTTSIPISEPETKPADDEMIDFVITIGNKSFAAKLFDNPSTQALTAQMPMTLNMSELNGNEKYYYLPSPLPIASERIGGIRNGDLMLYGSDCLVLFYGDFQTSYSYTKLGYIEDVTGLADALGSNSIQVTFSVARA